MIKVNVNNKTIEEVSKIIKYLKEQGYKLDQIEIEL